MVHLFFAHNEVDPPLDTDTGLATFSYKSPRLLVFNLNNDGSERHITVGTHTLNLTQSSLSPWKNKSITNLKILLDSSTWEKGVNPTSVPPTMETVCLAPERQYLLNSGSSAVVVSTIQSSRAMLTRSLYSSKWCWCAMTGEPSTYCLTTVIL